MKFLLLNLAVFLLFVNIATGTDSFIVILAEDNQSAISGNEVGTITVKDKMYKTTCTYDAGMEHLRKKALEQGANLVKILRYKRPDAFNSCHRFDATFYKVDNPREYEKQIIWSENRKLEWEDFRAENEPHAYNATALTYCGIEFGVSTLTSLYANNTKYIVKCIFYPEKSWVTSDITQRTADVLKHEQTHFDLCEVYARRLYKELTNTKINAFTLDNANTIYKRIMTEYEDRQYKYDDETHKATDAEMQDKWNNDIARELEELKEYADRRE